MSSGDLPATPRKEQNVQKRDTLLTQERAAVVNAVKRRPSAAVSRATKGAHRLIEDGAAKQALNVLTLAKDLVTAEKPAEAADYYLALASIHQAMDNPAPASRALKQAQELEGLDAEHTQKIAQMLEDNQR